MNKLSILLANGKIGEKSFLAATKTLKQKIVELKKTKENPDLSSTSSTASSEWNESANQLEKPSALWYLVPFLFGIIGGIVGYLGTKERDKGTADSLLIFGVVWTVILVIFYWVILAALFSQL